MSRLSRSRSRQCFAGLAVAAAGLLALSACSSSTSASSKTTSTAPAGQSAPASGDTLRVSLFNNFPPDAYSDNGQLVGWVPDMLAALQKQSGLTFQTTGVNQFDGLIPGLQSGRYDMSPSLFYITAQRLQAVDLVTISQVGTSFGANPASPVSVAAATDICGHKIATLSGSVFPTQVAELNKGCASGGKQPAVVQVYPDDSAAVLSVADGRNDLYAGTTDQVAYVQQQKKLTAEPFVYDKQLEAIAFPKGSKYEAKIQDAINGLIKSGQYASILDKWQLGSMAIPSSILNPSAG